MGKDKLISDRKILHPVMAYNKKMKERNKNKHGPHGGHKGRDHGHSNQSHGGGAPRTYPPPVAAHKPSQPVPKPTAGEGEEDEDEYTFEERQKIMKALDEKRKLREGQTSSVYLGRSSVQNYMPDFKAPVVKRDQQPTTAHQALPMTGPKPPGIPPPGFPSAGHPSVPLGAFDSQGSRLGPRPPSMPPPSIYAPIQMPTSLIPGYGPMHEAPQNPLGTNKGRGNVPPPFAPGTVAHKGNMSRLHRKANKRDDSADPFFQVTQNEDYNPTKRPDKKKKNDNQPTPMEDLEAEVADQSEEQAKPSNIISREAVYAKPRITVSADEKRAFMPTSVVVKKLKTEGRADETQNLSRPTNIYGDISNLTDVPAPAPLFAPVVTQRNAPMNDALKSFFDEIHKL